MKCFKSGSKEMSVCKDVTFALIDYDRMHFSLTVIVPETLFISLI